MKSEELNGHSDLILSAKVVNKNYSLSVSVRVRVAGHGRVSLLELLVLRPVSSAGQGALSGYTSRWL